MSTSIYVQFNADTLDPEALAQTLRSAGIPVLSVRKSRWVKIGPLTNKEQDAGPRLDFELAYQAAADAAPWIAALELFVASSLLVIKPPG
jgi:hypothetical protein